MNRPPADLEQVLEYRSDAVEVRSGWVGAGFLGLGFAIVALDPGAWAGWLTTAFGLAWLGYVLWRFTTPGKPVFTLTPGGVRYRVPMVKEFLLPWHAIEAVESREIVAWNWASRIPHRVRFADVTTLVVGRDVYDRDIHVEAPFLRGPSWDATFQVDGDRARVALHHELVSVDAEGLRQAVEARWRAFRERTAAAATVAPAPRVEVARPPSLEASAPAPDSDALPEAVVAGWFELTPRRLAAFLAGLAALLAVVTNVAGLWETPGQEARRLGEEKRAAAARLREAEEARDKLLSDKFFEDFFKN